MWGCGDEGMRVAEGAEERLFKRSAVQPVRSLRISSTVLLPVRYRL